jgi:hypothetical protein
MNEMTMGLYMKSIISKIIVADAVAAAIAVPAMASVSANFAVQDNHGVLGTKQAVKVGDVVTYEGRAETITFVKEIGIATAYIFRVAPGFSDPSGELNFSFAG